MNTNEKNIDFEALVAAYLSGSATQEETETLVQLLKDNSDIKQQFVQIRQNWRVLETTDFRFDASKGWDKISSHIQNRDTEPEKQDSSKAKIISRDSVARRRRVPGLVFRIAASLAFLVALSYSVYFYLAIDLKTITADLQPVTINLHDGSTVTLNRNTTFEHTRRFWGENRLVKLDGEAFFDVAANNKKPFLIETNDVTVKVVGTSFTVNTRAASGETQVVVSTGVVEMSDQAQNTIRITSGQKGTFSPDAGSLDVSTNEDPNFDSWRTRVLIFRDTPLNVVFEALGETYGVSFNLEQAELTSCALTATFSDMPLLDVLEVIKETFDVRYSRSTDNVVNVSGEGCLN